MAHMTSGRQSSGRFRGSGLATWSSASGHSNVPNVQVDPTEDVHGVDFAARDIEAREELTVDYGIVEGVRSE